MEEKFEHSKDKIWRSKSKKPDNTMSNEKELKKLQMVDKTLHIKLKIDQQENCKSNVFAVKFFYGPAITVDF